MPGTVEELEAAIQDNISEANSILFLNQNILEEYENRQHKVNECVLHKKSWIFFLISVYVWQIEAIEAKLQMDESELSGCLHEVNTLKVMWVYLILI